MKDNQSETEKQTSGDFEIRNNRCKYCGEEKGKYGGCSKCRKMFHFQTELRETDGVLKNLKNKKEHSFDCEAISQGKFIDKHCYKMKDGELEIRKVESYSQYILRTWKVGIPLPRK